MKLLVDETHQSIPRQLLTHHGFDSVFIGDGKIILHKVSQNMKADLDRDAIIPVLDSLVTLSMAL
jgi:hypothetical protein